MRIEAVIFDLDNTLYDEEQFVRSGFRAVSNYMTEKHGIDKEVFYHLLLSIFSKRGRERVFDTALSEMNLCKKEIVLEMVEIYRSHLPQISLYKAAHDVLLEIKKKYRVALITDGIKKVQESKVKALGIEDLFDVITYAIEHGGKNNIQAYLTTLRKLEIEPSQSVYIDDSPKGLTIARKLGIHTARILKAERGNIRVYEHYEPEFEIRNLQQIFSVIRTIQKSLECTPYYSDHEPEGLHRAEEV